MDVQPLYDRILVRRFPDEEKTPTRASVSDEAEPPHEGRVIAIGLYDGNVHGLPVVLGDRVLFTRGAGTELRIAGQLHVLLRDDEVVAIVD